MTKEVDVTLKYVEGSSNKFYNVVVQCFHTGGHVVYTTTANYGRNGASAQKHRKSETVERLEAVSVAFKILQEKIDKGYRISKVGTTMVQSKDFPKKGTSI